MVHADLRQQALEAEPDVGRAAALPEVLIEDEDSLGGPAQGTRMIGQGILAGDRLTILNHLPRRGLADIGLLSMRSGVAEDKPGALEPVLEVKDDTRQIHGAVDVGYSIKALVVEAQLARNVG